ncbi:hypothetical protein BABINDRAFT_163220 [Babjeviella inositovora NRRL Y-12698]|uniref:Aminotransferase class I/classII large domain-containing protein n=1 Tax=Babjeviella inositovora NRRL Y-12698 TaxID=984486 RepID=A0A1E3QJG5_9ASCO|nr:uncharacterized protein BABINDRAFT_163220 [Babjeviella inositovora NRRL Y-12698]ODQ77833.1 hypothetical protein BABINDRAFT_163220 [Babjeviella inositovora NRRL Y-12698]
MSINFFKGHPTADLLPSAALSAASQAVFQRFQEDPFQYENDPNNTHPLQYGTDRGNLAVRAKFAKWIDRTFTRATATDADCLNLTGGASYGIMNLLAQTTSQSYTRRVFIVSPTYFLINGTFIDAGFGGKLTAIEEQRGGVLDLAYLETQLQHYDSVSPIETTPTFSDAIPSMRDPRRANRRLYRYVMYLVPAYSNPRGGSYDLATRTRLIELARKHDVLLVCDDVYDLLSFDTPLDQPPRPLARLVELDRESMADKADYGHTVSNGTFSKLIGPGLRVGWQETVSPLLSNQLSQGGANKSGGSPAQLNTCIVGELVESGQLDEVIQTLRATYAKRAQCVFESSKFLPTGTVVEGGQGGYFVWITTPEGLDCRRVVELCKEQGVVLAGGDNFEVTGDERGWGDRSVRLSISLLSEKQIIQGMRIWGSVIRKLKEEQEEPEQKTV